MKRVSKALAAGIGGLVGAYGTAYADGSIDSKEWIGIIGAALVAAGITYLAPRNADATTGGTDN